MSFRVSALLTEPFRMVGRWIDRGHDYYGPVQVTRYTGIYPCRKCGARFYTHRRCPR